MAKKQHQPEIVLVKPPLEREGVYPLWDKAARSELRLIEAKKWARVYDMGHYLQIRLRREIGRATVYRYANEGVPLSRGGRRLLLPTVYVVGQLHTSFEAIDRFVKRLQEGDVQ